MCFLQVGCSFQLLLLLFSFWLFFFGLMVGGGGGTSDDDGDGGGGNDRAQMSCIKFSLPFVRRSMCGFFLFLYIKSFRIFCMPV